MRVLVTGATGFIGFHVARFLTEKGIQVRALVRGQSDVAALKALDIEPVNGDIRTLNLSAGHSPDAGNYTTLLQITGFGFPIPQLCILSMSKAREIAWKLRLSSALRRSSIQAR